MAVVNLLGDSIIDNKIYVGPHELSVSEHLYNLTDDPLEKNNLIKILGRGEINSPIKIEANKFSKSAEDSIKNAGGEIIIK